MTAEVADDMSILSETHMRCALKTLGHTSDGFGIAYLTANLTNLGLKDITFLKRYIHLQEVDLSQNQLENIETLQYVKHLVTLKLSKNMLKYGVVMPSIAFCTQIQILDLSYNQITAVEPFKQLQFLHELNLSHNKIENGVGDSLKHMTALRVLDLSYNVLKSCAGLETCTQLLTLNLSHNQIETVGELRPLKTLQTLFIQENDVMDVVPIGELDNLHTLDVSRNNIHNVVLLKSFADLHALHSLTVADNPMMHHYSAEMDPLGSNDAHSGEQMFNDSVQGDTKSNNNTNGKRGSVALPPIEEDAQPIFVVPEEEDQRIRSTLSITAAFRLKILYFVPQIWVLDGQSVTPDEKTTSMNLEGGEDHEARRNIQKEIFGDNGDGTHVLKKVPKRSK